MGHFPAFSSFSLSKLIFLNIYKNHSSFYFLYNKLSLNCLLLVLLNFGFSSNASQMISMKIFHFFEFGFLSFFVFLFLYNIYIFFLYLIYFIYIRCTFHTQIVMKIVKFLEQMNFHNFQLLICIYFHCPLNPCKGKIKFKERTKCP